MIEQEKKNTDTNTDRNRPTNAIIQNKEGEKRYYRTHIHIHGFISQVDFPGNRRGFLHPFVKGPPSPHPSPFLFSSFCRRRRKIYLRPLRRQEERGKGRGTSHRWISKEVVASFPSFSPIFSKPPCKKLNKYFTSILRKDHENG